MLVKKECNLTSCKGKLKKKIKLKKTEWPILKFCVANGRMDGRTEPNSLDTSASAGLQNR